MVQYSHAWFLVEAWVSILPGAGMSSPLSMIAATKSVSPAASAMAWLTRGYGLTPHDVVGDALFAEEHKSMVLVRDIEMYSLC